MELGAMVCLPRNPKCGICPLADSCKACAQGDPERFPAKKARPSVVEVVRDVVVASHRDGVYLRPSRPDELLRGLLVPPNLTEAVWLETPDSCGEIRHSITHHKVVWRVRGKSRQYLSATRLGAGAFGRSGTEIGELACSQSLGERGSVAGHLSVDGSPA
jgi:adenine-specific DNA glycosylase